MKFDLQSKYQPAGDQPDAIQGLVDSLSAQNAHQVLLGVTGSGKTYTIANVIQKLQRPTLIISHNKTLAGQLYQEFRDFFPNNAVSYFVSYYDYYQPEAYIPTTDTYIEKETQINEEIDKLRLLATTHLQNRDDVIVVASVSCIYNLGSPEEYANFVIRLKIGEVYERQSFLLELTRIQYGRSDYDLKRGTFRVRGDNVEVWPAYADQVMRLQFIGNTLGKLVWVDPLTGKPVESLPDLVAVATTGENIEEYWLYPAKHYLTDPKQQKEAFDQIRTDLALRLTELKAAGKTLEAYRLEQRVNYDLDMISELGFVNGIENYSRYFDGRKPGDPPFTLIDHFRQKKDWLLVIDESHITLPQVRGMYNGDQARKKTLIDYGFRLPSALDNRPLQFTEFLSKINQVVYVSATPAEWELTRPKVKVVEQLVRPTGLIDPEVEIRPTENQIENLTKEIILRKAKGQRVLVTTLTKRLAEALTDYLNEEKNLRELMEAMNREGEMMTNQEGETSTSRLRDTGHNGEIPHPNPPLKGEGVAQRTSPNEDGLPKVAYLHSDIETLDRQDILDDLRRGTYDVLVGINLLREGLDLPEVTLVAILDADKEGFLRSQSSLIQIMGRAARHSDGHVIMYADNMTKSMTAAIEEVKRRRDIQLQYNKVHGITPISIQKEIRKRLIEYEKKEEVERDKYQVKLTPKGHVLEVGDIKPEDFDPDDRKTLIKRLQRVMLDAAKNLDFEKAAKIRDKIRELEAEGQD